MSGSVSNQVSVLIAQHGHLDRPAVAADKAAVIAMIVAGLAAVAAAGVVLLGRELPRGRFVAALAASLAVATGALLVSVTRAEDSGLFPDAGTPRLGALALAGKQVPVLVVPNRPGFNLVAVGAPDAGAGTDRDRLIAGERRPGSAHTWVAVDLPAGPSKLWVSAGGATGALDVDTGSDAAPTRAALRGPDGPECASAVVGALLANGDAADACPSDGLSEADAEALRTTVDFLAGRGERGLALVSDESPRGVAAAGEVRSAAQRAGLTVTAPDGTNRPLVVVAGWAGAEAVVRDVDTGAVVAQSTYLAPWLLSSALLRRASGQQIPLRYPPRDPAAGDYLAALAARVPGEAPSAAGYLAWHQARGRSVAADPVRLYAVAAAPYMPGMGGVTAHDHGSTPDWLPGGLIIPVTGPLPER
ncbi:hypothetical protein SUDANB95_04126 [Actinosynnema sp. ALI-1.44]